MTDWNIIICRQTPVLAADVLDELCKKAGSKRPAFADSAGFAVSDHSTATGAGADPYTASGLFPEPYELTQPTAAEALPPPPPRAAAGPVPARQGRKRKSRWDEGAASSTELPNNLAPPPIQAAASRELATDPQAAPRGRFLFNNVSLAAAAVSSTLQFLFQQIIRRCLATNECKRNQVH